MNVGILQMNLRLPESHSLKEKRQVVKSLTAQLHNRYNVSAAEVADNDLWQLAGIAVACLSNDKTHTNEVLNKARAFAATYDLEVVEADIEIIDI
ncbi:YlxP-like protein [Dehalogenimonas sp. WBC-2]|nr:YlxP-like protein [Dehalogenimonas sp. WBC-2]